MNEGYKSYERFLKEQKRLIDKCFMSKDAGQKENEVIVTQYMRPNGEKRIMYAPLGVNYRIKAEHMVCSAEQLGTGEVAIYIRWDYQTKEEELIELAENGPGSQSPNETLKRMIDRLWKSREVWTEEDLEQAKIKSKEFEKGIKWE